MSPSKVLHSPYNKLVKKSGARMLYNDVLRNPDLPIFKKNGENKELEEIVTDWLSREGSRAVQEAAP